MKDNLIFRQLFDSKSFTYTYLLADRKTREAILIDPVIDLVERDLKVISDLDLKLKYVLDTHIHADHVTGAGKIRAATGAKSVVGAGAKVSCVDISAKDGDTFQFGEFAIRALSTPGHTDSCTTFVGDDMAFTGDALLIRSNGRTDFQGGSAEKLYHSIKDKIYRLPPETVIFPGHDYQGNTVSSVEEELRLNKRIALKTTMAQFVKTMQSLQLPPPAMLKQAVASNLACGEMPMDVSLMGDIVSTEGAVCSGEVPVCSGEMSSGKVASCSPATLLMSQEFDRLLKSEPRRTFIDVRTVGEYSGEFIPGSVCIPLSELPNRLGEVPKNQPVFLLCRSGNRSKQAAAILSKSGYGQVVELRGGIAQWIRDGMSTQKAATYSMPVEQQTMLTIGLMVLTGITLSLVAHPFFLAISGFVGCGLLYAGISGDCKLTQILLKMPWNRV